MVTAPSVMKIFYVYVLKEQLKIMSASKTLKQLLATHNMILKTALLPRKHVIKSLIFLKASLD